MVEISADLQEKLKMIELETEFFTDKPDKPKYLRFSNWVIAVSLLVVIILSFVDESYNLALFLLIIGILLVDNISRQRQLFNMYSDACEIINYYKTRDKL